MTTGSTLPAPKQQAAPEDVAPVTKKPGSFGLAAFLLFFLPIMGLDTAQVVSSVHTGVTLGDGTPADSSPDTRYLFGTSDDRGIWISPPSASADCWVTTNAGDTLTLDPVMTSPFIVENHKLIAKFPAPHSGYYTIGCTADDATATYKIALGTSSTFYYFCKYATVPLIAGGIISGLTTLIVVLARRAKWSKHYAATTNAADAADTAAALQTPPAVDSPAPSSHPK